MQLPEIAQAGPSEVWVGEMKQTTLAGRSCLVGADLKRPQELLILGG